MDADSADVAAMKPVLVLTVGPHSSLRCVGRLDGQTRHHLVAAVEQMIRSEPETITIDVGKLRLADDVAASTLVRVQRLAREAGTSVHWHGVGADHLRQAPALDVRGGMGRPKAASLAAWHRENPGGRSTLGA